MELTRLIKIKDIEQNENSRVVYKEHDLADLMRDMKKRGLLQPIGVAEISKNKYEAIYGNRRLLAAKKLGWDEIEAKVRTIDNQVDLLLENLAENIKRAQTTLAEDGRTFKLLMDMGLKEDEIAARLDITNERVKAALDVVEYVPVQFHNAMVNKGNAGRHKGTISPTVTHKLLNLRKTHQLKKPQFAQVLKKAQEGLNIRQIEKIAPLVSSGMKIQTALREVESIRVVTLEVLVNRKESEAIEKKQGKNIRSILTQELCAYSAIKSIRPARLNDAGEEKVS